MRIDAPQGNTPESDRGLALVRDLFATASELAAADRDDFLDRACAGNGALRGEVGDLLARESRLGGFLAHPLAVPRSFATRPILALPGDRIGGCEVLQFLARGGSGEVFRARQLETGRDVALKLISTADLAEHARERFAREARIASEIRHPHLVEVVAFGEERGMHLLYLAMRFVSGPTLAELLGDFVRLGTRPDPACRLSLIARFREVARALAALHEQRVVHRDVKPANIMFDGTGRPPHAQPAILVDLGLARDLHGGQSSSVWLAFGYAPPERVDGRMDETGDVYSLGLTMYDVLTGGTPALRNQFARRALPPLGSLLPDVDPDLSLVVATATHPHPRWRYAHAGLLADDLDAVLARRRIAERRASIVRRTWRSARRNPRRALAIVALSVIVLAALAVAVLSLLDANRAAATARDAYGRGDLVTVERVLAGAPELASLWIPRSIGSLADPRSGDPTPDQRVFALVRSDRVAACKLAACYLERDGLRQDPLLAAFLLHELDAGAPEPKRLAARLFRERPDASAADTLASAGFRRSFARIMRSKTVPSTTLSAMSALGGCGDAESAHEILAWAGAGFDGIGTSEQLEERRLSAWTIAHIIARSGACGFRAPLAPVVAADALQRLAPDPERQSATTWERFASAGTQLAMHHSFLLRAEGLPAEPLWEASVGPLEELHLRAARADPDLVAELQRGGALSALLAERCPALDPIAEAGFIAGAIDDPPLTTALEREACERPGEDAARAVDRFRGSLAEARATAGGRDPLFVLDADTHLRAELERPDEGDQELPMDRIEAEAAVLASWEFDAEPYRLSGSAERCSARGVSMGRDEVIAGARYARLYLPGVSVLRLPFEVQPVDGGYVTLRIQAQKNTRSSLPCEGAAMLEVWIDGEIHANDLRLVATSHQSFTIPLCSANEVHRRTLEIRLGEDAETPVRIYRVSIMK